MADNKITIDVSKVNSAGQSIIDNGTKMYNALNDIRDIVNNTKKCMQSDGGDSARTNFNSSAEKFDSFKKFVHDYGEFLKGYGKAHIDVDSKIAEFAQKIPKL